jgi:ABC-type multidrug transport system fused ATPase/permease subunit
MLVSPETLIISLQESTKSIKLNQAIYRLSTIRNADKILVIDQGHVRESGTHEELIQIPDGVYAGLSKLQYRSEETVGS